MLSAKLLLLVVVVVLINTITTRILEMLGRFLNLNKIKTKEFQIT